LKIYKELEEIGKKKEKMKKKTLLHRATNRDQKTEENQQPHQATMDVEKYFLRI
jgi:hypothetical protein